MKKLALTLFLSFALISLCYGEGNNNNWKKRLAKAEWDFKQVQRRQDVMYEILKKIGEKLYGKRWEKIYEDILWTEREE